LSWPLLLLLVQLIQRLPNNVVFLPIDRWAANNILWLGDRGEFVCACGGSYIGGVFAHLYPRLPHFHIRSFTRHRVCQTGERRAEYIIARLCCLRSVFLYRLGKAFGVRDSNRLELGKSPQVALALLALQLQERYCGSQCYDIWILTLRYSYRGRLLSECRDWWGRGAGCFCALNRRELGYRCSGSDG
jgi:hypothetical protein